MPPVQSNFSVLIRQSLLANRHEAAGTLSGYPAPTSDDYITLPAHVNPAGRPLLTNLPHPTLISDRGHELAGTEPRGLDAKFLEFLNCNLQAFAQVGGPVRV